MRAKFDARRRRKRPAGRKARGRGGKRSRDEMRRERRGDTQRNARWLPTTPTRRPGGRLIVSRTGGCRPRTGLDLRSRPRVRGAGGGPARLRQGCPGQCGIRSTGRDPARLLLRVVRPRGSARLRARHGALGARLRGTPWSGRGGLRVGSHALAPGRRDSSVGTPRADRYEGAADEEVAREASRLLQEPPRISAGPSRDGGSQARWPHELEGQTRESNEEPQRNGGE